jgi:hypothetical protein
MRETDPGDAGDSDGGGQASAKDREVRAGGDEVRGSADAWGRRSARVSSGGGGFTDVDANTPGKAQYNAKVAKRAYKAMNDFFAEAFGG